MNAFNIIVLAIAVYLFGCSSNNQDVSQKDMRIISLSPHITEIIYAIGADSNLVAVSDFCRYPPAAQKKEKIGGLIDPNIEKIVALKPSLIIGVPAHAKLNSDLRQFDLSIVMLTNETVDDVLTTIDSIGILCTRKQAANELIDTIQDMLSALKNAPKKQSPSALLVIGREKGSLKNITAAASNTFISEMWHLAGGKNAFPNLPSRYAMLNLEAIITRNPDVIIEFAIDDSAQVIRQTAESEWNKLNSVKAIKRGHIFRVSGNHTLIPGPRLTVLAGQFKEIIQLITAHKLKDR
jgi:iron complex transport system substrate-binding protein